MQTVAFAFDATHPDADDLAELGLVRPPRRVPRHSAQLFLLRRVLAAQRSCRSGSRSSQRHGGHRLDVEEEHLAQVADDFAAHGRCPWGIRRATGTPASYSDHHASLSHQGQVGEVLLRDGLRRKMYFLSWMMPSR